MLAQSKALGKQQKVRILCCSSFVSFHLLCNETYSKRQQDLTAEFKVGLGEKRNGSKEWEGEVKR